MKNLERKLIISILSLGLILITLTSTTFAWFARNSEAWIEGFDINLENQEGLLISIDGKNFSTAISSNNIKRAIVAKKNNIDINNMTPEEEWLLDEELDNQFKKIILKPVTTHNLEDFNEIDSNIDRSISEYYSLKKADKFNYIEFDVYFKIVTSEGKAVNDYELGFVKSYDALVEQNVSFISSKAENVNLLNTLTTPDKVFNSGEKISINASNAMRLGVITEESQKFIYEPNMGYGSYALKGEEELIYNPDFNAMLTYFNNTHLGKLKPLEDNFDVYKNTLKSFDQEAILGNFSPLEGNSEYNTVKLSIYIWLEGYDADYFAGAGVDQISAYLNFSYREKKQQSNN